MAAGRQACTPYLRNSPPTVLPITLPTAAIGPPIPRARAWRTRPPLRWLAWPPAGALAATLCGPVLMPASQAVELKTIAISDKTTKARMAIFPSLKPLKDASELYGMPGNGQAHHRFHEAFVECYDDAPQ